MKTPKPFGFLRNFEWWLFFGSIGHDSIWLRMWPLNCGLEIQKKSPLSWPQTFSDWKVRILKALP